jgi:hypothetical protein
MRALVTRILRSWLRPPAPARRPAPRSRPERSYLSGDGPPPTGLGRHGDSYKDLRTGERWARLGGVWNPAAERRAVAPQGWKD